MALIRFEGNCPRNIGKVAKYAVRHRASTLVVSVVYDTTNGERWFATTEDHPELVRMVSEAKLELTGSPAGPFYLNEYRQVIVPGPRGEYILAGEYARPLLFEFEGRILSGEPRGEDGQALQPGDPWTGPRPGIPYRLAAGGNDIYYKVHPRPNVVRKVLLSQAHSSEGARTIANRIRQIKGWQGGRFYVNEWRALFAPRATATGWDYVYLGQLAPEDPWFPKPHSEG